MPNVEIGKIKNGREISPVISPWLESDSEAAYLFIISHIG